MPIRELDPGAVGGRVRATTILTVRHNGKVVMAGDGQVSVGQTIMARFVKSLPAQELCCFRPKELQILISIRDRSDLFLTHCKMSLSSSVYLEN